MGLKQKKTVMTERELVLNNLDKLYTLNSDNGSITIEDRYDTSSTSFSSLVKEMNQLFGIYTHDTCEEWYKKTYSDICGEVHDYLKPLRFHLGRSDWELYHKDNELFNIEDLYDTFEGQYSKELLLHIYERWYEDAVIQHCEIFYPDL